MTDDYQRAISRAAAFDAPAVALPAHLRPDPMAFARSLAEPFGAEAVSVIEQLAFKRQTERASASEARERSGDSGAPASERVGGPAGAQPPGVER
jgi:hypothetical protein